MKVVVTQRPVASRTRRWLLAGVVIAVCLAAVAVGSLLNRDGGSPTAVDGDGDTVERPDGETVGTVDPISSAPIPARVRPHAVWSDRELLVWSGARAQGQEEPTTAEVTFDFLGDGAAYDPTTDTWRPLPAAPIPGRVGAAAVWAGDRLLVWGGFNGPGDVLADGAAYVPSDDRWVEVSPAPLSARGDATAVWTGSEVLIVGGAERPGQPGHVSGVRRDGAAYDPATDRWRMLPPVPDGVWPLRDRGIGPIRERFAGTWTGGTLFVWGRDVGIYDPTENSWLRVTAPSANYWLGGRPQAVSTGDHVVIVGLAVRGDPRTFGLLSTPTGDAFASVPALRLGDMNAHRQVVATGDHVVVLLPGSPAAVRWHPDERAWRPLPTALAERTEASVVWTGDVLLVWGGYDGGDWRTDGVTWTP